MSVECGETTQKRPLGIDSVDSLAPTERCPPVTEKRSARPRNKLFFGPFHGPRSPEGKRELFTGTVAQLHPRFISQARRGRGFCVTPNGKAQCPTARRKQKPNQHYSHHVSTSNTIRRDSFRRAFHAMRGWRDCPRRGVRPPNKQRGDRLGGSI